MFNVMHQAWRLLLLVLVHGTYAQRSLPSWVSSLPTFADPDANELFLAVVHNETGDVFVGGQNVLYHFSSDLELKVSIFRLICQVRPIDNLEEYHWVEPYNETLGFTTNENIKSYALFNRGLDGQTSLITASFDDNDKRNSKSAPFLSSKILKKDGDRFYFQYTYQSNFASSRVVFKSDSSRYPCDDGFTYGGFIYFPVLYHQESTVLFVVKRVERENKLVRFCANDTTFRSYAELPIICKYEDKVLKNLVAAHLGPSKKYPDKSALYTIFMDDEKTGSALCIFPMREIEKAFTTYERRCNDDIVGETCGRKQMTQVSDFCGSEVRPYICTHTCMVKYFVFVRGGVTISFITVLKQRNGIVVIARTKQGELIKINGTTGVIISRKLILGKKLTHAKPFTYDQQNKHAYLLAENKVIKYPVASCRAHETCKECFTRGKSDPLGCGWCSDGRCSQEEECAHPQTFSLDTCTPVLIGAFPKRSPIQGSNNFTIFGDNFGSYVDAERNSVLVAGIPCTPTFWNNTLVNCTLGATPTEISGPVSLFSTNNYSSSLGYSIGGSLTTKNNFTYYAGPRLYGIRPSKGPDSGGTQVTLYGQNLDDDKEKQRFVSVYGRLCHIKKFDANTITCVTSYPWGTKEPNHTIALEINQILYVLDKHPPSDFNTSGLSQTFDFTIDPFITNIQPGYTTVSGLMNLTATGKYFDSVQFPKLVMKVDENQIVGKTEFIEDCFTDPQSNGTMMTCHTPSLKDRLVYPTRTRPLLASVSFLMDGVEALSSREFPRNHRDLSRLLYYPDPDFTVFDGTEKVKNGQKLLQIRGDNLDLLHSKEKLKVRIGTNETCVITRVSSETLSCNLAPSLFSSNSPLNETNLPVEVLSGSTTHLLGYIELDHQKDPQANTQEESYEGSQEEGTNLWVILLVTAVVVICSLVAFVSYKYCWCPGKKLFPFNPTTPTSVNNDYRPIRTFVPRVQDEQIVIKEPLNQSATVYVRRGPVLNGSLSMALVNAAPPIIPEDRASTLESSLVEEIFPNIDKNTLLQFAQRNLIISNRYLTVFSDEKLGSGHFGCVYKGVLRRPNEIEQIQVAVKVLHQHSWTDPMNVEIFLQEAEVMLNLHHPNVVGLHGVCFDKEGPSIVLPFLCNGSLYEYLRDETKAFKVSDLLKFAVDVAAGMKYLEKKFKLHRDLAARNILLDRKRNAMVSDFGLSRDIYSKGFYDWQKDSETKVPMKWTAPEALKNRNFTTKSDVWSFGVLIWEIMTRGMDPYNEVPNFEMLEYLFGGRRLPWPEKCPLPVYKVMLACWNLDKDLRPTFAELHEYLSFLYQDLLRSMGAQSQPEPVYVPAKHSVYHDDSKEMYLSMAGKPLQWEVDNEAINNA
ncbi:hypothetical protein JTE90_025398 [Oedothorax gibbosus]|uniref:receptor protein-tyrosine kinase n=1 Tax=Oedothorax gibbosus TaxID=931172 RepID=A0AAV6UIY1_9ARAC|nr:hypothetical protein JTE90_025398 [Oedothorax gibbosus]